MSEARLELLGLIEGYMYKGDVSIPVEIQILRSDESGELSITVPTDPLRYAEEIRERGYVNSRETIRSVHGAHVTRLIKALVRTGALEELPDGSSFRIPEKFPSPWSVW